VIPFPMRVYLYTRDADMRRSFNGLVGIIQSEFKMDILKGDMFLFLSKRRDRIKAICVGWRWYGDLHEAARGWRIPKTTHHHRWMLRDYR